MGSVHLDADEYRQYTHAAETPSKADAHPDQWVDWGEHTMTVDPPLTKQWIHDSHDGHVKSADRARFYDAQRVREIKNWEQTTRNPFPTPYIPSVAEINNADLYSQPRDLLGCRSWRGAPRDSRNFGKLPSISQLLRSGQLGEKSTGDIEAEMREAERTRGARIHQN